jgi:hypothetical protein
VTKPGLRCKGDPIGLFIVACWGCDFTVPFSANGFHRAYILNGSLYWVSLALFAVVDSLPTLWQTCVLVAQVLLRDSLLFSCCEVLWLMQSRVSRLRGKLPLKLMKRLVLG